MRKARVLGTTLVAVAAGMIGASSASAQLLPPELSGPLHDLRLPGIATSDTSSNEASSSAVDLEGVAAVNKGETSTDSAQVTRVSLLGEDLLVKNAAGENEGSLAPVGDLVDDLNAALCPGGADETGTCLAVLNAQTSDNTVGESTEHGAHSSVLQLSAEGTGIYVLPATSISGTEGDRCRTLSASDVAAIGTVDGEILRIASQSEETNTPDC